jgi:MFS superfamily sulfate permease-like transporter
MRPMNLLAGISVAGLLLPEAVAYAGIAGLPPDRAILAGIVGGLAYAAIGRSRFAIVSATSTTAAILAATLATIPASAGEKGALATMVVALVGILLLAASALRLGVLTDFISRPVLRGFAFGLAVTIIIRQLPGLVGLAPASSGPFDLLGQLFLAVRDWHFVSLGVGAVALAALLMLRRYPAIPGTLLVLIAGIAASFLFDLTRHGVTVVGATPFALAWPSLPAFDWPLYSRLAQLSLPLVVILFAESWGTMRTLALHHGDRLGGNRELAALGVANLASAMVRGMPVSAGFSASAANEGAGTTSKVAALTALGGLALLAAVATPAMALLPHPVLAAVVIAALAHAIDPAPIQRLWAMKRDYVVAICAAAAVLMLGIVNGMLVAIGLSVIDVLHRLSSPHIARLGRIGVHDYVDVARHDDAVMPPGIAIWRPAAPLFFANADRVLAAIAARSIGREPIHGIVVSLEESIDFDSTAMDALVEFDASMRAAGIAVRYARVHDLVRDLMDRSGAGDLHARSSFSVDDAVAALIGAGRPLAGDGG